MIKTHRCKNEATTNTDGGGSDAQQSDRGPVHRNLFRGREQQQQQQFVLEHGRPGGFTDAWIFVEEANEKRAKNEKWNLKFRRIHGGIHGKREARRFTD